MAPDSLHVCLIAGEASGDFLGAGLMRALKENGVVRFSGVGGPLMQAEGLISLFPMEELSVMGIAEILPRLPHLMRRIRQTADHIKTTKPDIVVTIDAPDFCFRVASRVKDPHPDPLPEGEGGTHASEWEGEGIKKKPLMIHYVAPTVWAWRPERAAKIAKLYDGILCLLPFEPPYFEREGLKAIFVGHPILESGLGQGNGPAFRAAHGISADAEVLGLFFGSRRGELKRMGPVLREAAIRLAAEHSGLHIVSPTLPHLRDKVEGLLHGLPFPYTVIADLNQKNDAFAAMDAALATSGTVGLELAVAGVPHAIGYKTNALTAWIVRRKVMVRYAHLVNILLDQPAVPEFLQEKCTAEDLKNSAEILLHDRKACESQLEKFKQVREMLGQNNGDPPLKRVTEFMLSLF
jgi:lipid-A-disaccharide synthase